MKKCRQREPEREKNRCFSSSDLTDERDRRSRSSPRFNVDADLCQDPENTRVCGCSHFYKLSQFVIDIENGQTLYYYKLFSCCEFFVRIKKYPTFEAPNPSDENLDHFP